MKNKKLLSTILGIAIVAAIGFGLNPMQKITSVHADTAQINPMPNEQWFSLNGITLKSGEFLDLVDTTPFMTTKGHVAAYLPCDKQGNTPITYLQGVVDVGVNTLTPVDKEYLPQLSTPGKNCLYHFDIGTSEGATDFAIINSGKQPVHFEDRNTLTFSSTEGFIGGG
ncbi:MAG TPA: hypothetical protein VEU72_03860 [Nitrosopumilaceae archaeon]|nr:hypothetical protein [Nitrosopumilaceae archaeon]